MSGEASSVDDPLDADRIAQYCARELPQTPLQLRVLQEVDSTSSEVARWRLQLGGQQTLAVAAEYQSAGRGRRGRRWQAPSGSSVHLSVGRRLHCAHGLAPLGLACAVAVCEVLRDAGARGLALKWPNDIVCTSDDHAKPYAKLGGLLLEASSTGGVAAEAQDVVVGIGLNVSLPGAYRQALEGEVDYAVADFRAIGLEAIGRGSVVARLLVATVRVLQVFERQGFAQFVERWGRLDMLYGRVVRVLANDGATREGVASGIDEDGALCVRVPGETEPLRVHCGEVSVRPT